MSSFISSILFFIIAIGILVTAHEFGHFWVARKLGVKVLKFSVGFGKPLFSWKSKKDGVEYILAAIPLGGYVKMLDEREEPVVQSELPMAFNRQPVGTRFAIVAAGPIFNFILAIFLYMMMFMLGVSGAKPIVGDITESSIAQQAGFQKQDLIRSINGEEATTWRDVFIDLMAASLSSEKTHITVENINNDIRERVIHFESDLDVDNEYLLESIGLTRYRPDLPAVIENIVGGGAADRAGLKPGDHIIKADDLIISDWQSWVEYIRSHPEEQIALQIQRDGFTRDIVLTPELITTKNQQFGRIGASVHVPENYGKDLYVIQKLGPIDAFFEGVDKTWTMSALTLKMMGNLILGELPANSISGPISIAQFAGASASAGLIAYLGFLALISISLGVLNLLPIPVLDGGHLFFYLAEIIMRKPLPDQVQLHAQKVGIAILIGVMALAFYNDIVRLFN